MARAATLALAVLMLGGAGAVIPNPGAGDYVIKMGSANFDGEVKRVVDAGKTLMAPSWNAVTEKFAHNPSVEFGDVILSEDRVAESHGEPQNPGAGGWPTIRYYNKATGYGGKPYPKKHDGMAMCDELGDEGRMEDYVVEVSGASLCQVDSQEKCTSKESEYISKMRASSPADVNAQLARLSKMDGGTMKPELKQWLKQRLAILKQLSASAEL